MTYKTLVRKSDGHYAKIDIDDAGIYDIETPELLDKLSLRAIQSLYPELQFNDYEIIEVYVIRKSDMPSDEDIWKEINIRIPDEYYAQECGKIINKLKSQILKP